MTLTRAAKRAGERLAFIKLAAGAFRQLDDRSVEWVAFDICGERGRYEDDYDLYDALTGEECDFQIRLRDAWYSPGCEHDAAADEFQIILDHPFDGKPGVRLFGHMDDGREILAIWLQCQPAGTIEWTDIWLDDEATVEIRAFAKHMIGIAIR